MNSLDRAKLSAPFFLLGLMGNIVVSILLAPLMIVWWPLLYIICSRVLTDVTASSRQRSVVLGAAYSVLFFVVIFLLVLPLLVNR